MKYYYRPTWKRLLVLIGLVVLSMWLFSCKPNENEGGKDWATVSLDIGQSRSSNQVNAATTGLPSGFSAMIVAVPETVTSVTSNSYITEFYARGMLSTDGSVEMTLPLDTPMRVLQVSFPVSYSLADILGSTPPAFLYGVSSSTITVSGGTQTVTVTIGLTSMDFYVFIATAGLLSPTGLSVQNNGGDTLPIPLNGILAFPAPLAYGDPYNVTIATQPTLGKCVVAGGSGTISVDNTPMAKVFCLMGGAVMGTMTNQPNLAALSGLLEANSGVSTLAGNAAAQFVNGIGVIAGFNGPQKVTTDGTNLYVSDIDNNAIRKVVIATGEVTTLAGGGAMSAGTSGNADGTGTNALFNGLKGITTDGTNLYVADTINNLIRKVVIATGVVSTLAGSGSAGASNGTGNTAEFDEPEGITTDGTSLYVADTANHSIRKINIASTVVSTLAGSGASGALNGTGISASFTNPGGITTDGTSLYVADTGNHEIRKIVGISGATDGDVSRLAGTSGTNIPANGTGDGAAFDSPRGITTDGTNLFVTGTGSNSHRIRKITSISGPTNGVVTTLAGSAAGFSEGTGTVAEFNSPSGVISDGTNLYITDTNNHRIRKIEKNP